MRASAPPCPEPRPHLDLSPLHVSSCCFFHERVQEIKKVGKDLGITPTIIRDEQLKARGFGGGQGWASRAVASGRVPGTGGGRVAVGHAWVASSFPWKEPGFIRPQGQTSGSKPSLGEKGALIQIPEAAASKSFPSPLSVHEGCRPGCLGQLSRTLLLLAPTSPRSHQGLVSRLSFSGVPPRDALTAGPSYLHVLGRIHLFRGPFLITRPIFPAPPPPLRRPGTGGMVTSRIRHFQSGWGRVTSFLIYGYQTNYPRRKRHTVGGWGVRHGWAASWAPGLSQVETSTLTGSAVIWRLNWGRCCGPSQSLLRCHHQAWGPCWLFLIPSKQGFWVRESEQARRRQGLFGNLVSEVVSHHLRHIQKQGARFHPNERGPWGQGSVGAILEGPAAQPTQTNKWRERLRTSGNLHEEMAFTAGFAGYTSVCWAAVICSHPDVNDRSVRFLGGPEAWSLPTRGFLEKTGHVHPAVRQWWERAQRGWCSAERTASVGWSGLEALSKNHFILQSCSFLSGNDTVVFFFSSAGFLA